MLTPLDPRFVAETALYALRATCADCVHFENETSSCSLSYPTDAHRSFPAPTPGALFVFCKAFELG